MSDHVRGSSATEAGSVSGGRTQFDPEPGGPRLSLVPNHADRRRLDVRLAWAGVRQLVPSEEPVRVFGHLADVCMSAVPDDCTIEICEYGGHRYRIQLPVGELESAHSGPLTEDEMQRPAASDPATGIGKHSVTARFSSTEGDCREYSGVVVCRWTDGYQPTDADAGLIGLLVQHATAVIERERLTRQVAELRANAGRGLALPGHLRIAAAVGILMALHHLSAGQAADLLTRASEHTHQSIRGVADTVLRTGAMPEHVHHRRETG